MEGREAARWGREGANLQPRCGPASAWLLKRDNLLPAGPLPGAQEAVQPPSYKLADGGGWVAGESPQAALFEVVSRAHTTRVAATAFRVRRRKIQAGFTEFNEKL